MGKGRQDPKQISTTQAHPRAEPMQNRISLALPCPKAQAGQWLYLRWQLDRRERTGCSWKGEQVGEGPELSRFPIPHLPSFRNNLYPATQLWLAPECLASGPTWNALGKEPGTTPSWQLLWRQREQLHRVGRHRIHPDGKRGHRTPLTGGSLRAVPAGWEQQNPHCSCRQTPQIVKVLVKRYIHVLCTYEIYIHTSPKTTCHPNLLSSDKLGSSGHSRPHVWIDKRHPSSSLTCSLNYSTWTLFLPELQNSTQVQDEWTGVLHSGLCIH